MSKFLEFCYVLSWWAMLVFMWFAAGYMVYQLYLAWELYLKVRSM
jgi:hypothetical protein